HDEPFQPRTSYTLDPVQPGSFAQSVRTGAYWRRLHEIYGLNSARVTQRRRPSSTAVTAVTTGGFGLEQRQCDYGHNALPRGTLDQKRSADQSRLLAQSRGPLRELAMPVAILLVIPFGLL